MIPKLIVAAVLVNVSYIICGIAVDASNILGNSLQQMFMDMQHDLVGASTTVNTDASSWSSWTSFIPWWNSSNGWSGDGRHRACVRRGCLESCCYFRGRSHLVCLSRQSLHCLFLLFVRRLSLCLSQLHHSAFVAYLPPGTEMVRSLEGCHALQC